MVTDIPDWCYVETEGSNAYNFKTNPVVSPSLLKNMHERSPVAHIDKVKTPTLLCLGGHDRRVPPGQGIEYYHLLKARGVESRLLWFPDDNHSIDKPISEFEQWMVTTDWISSHF